MTSNPLATKLALLQKAFTDQATEKLQAGGGECAKPKKVQRTKEEIRRAHDAFYDKTMREIDELVNQYHAVMSRQQSDSIGALYARYSSRFQDSIADQVRTILDDAARKKVYIPRDKVFFDLAVRGWKDRRPGLLALQEQVELKTIQTFMAFSTSRLYRRTYKSLKFIEEDLVERGIRAIFVKSHIDTADGDHWHSTLQALAANDEAQVRLYGAHIQAAHEGLFIRKMVHTSLILGYTGEVVQGEFTRRQRPRRKIVIDPDAAIWIVKIFYWYVVEELSIGAIARKLNANPDAPAPNKSTTGLWTHRSVRRHLRRKAYLGDWVYGENETTWSSRKDYAEQTPRVEPLKSGHFDELQIIPDECWYAAQKRLAREPGNSGCKSKDGTRKPTSSLLRGLFVCPEHGRRLSVGGANGRVLLCPTCRFIEVENRPLFTHFNRELALHLTFNKIVEMVRSDVTLVDSIIAGCAGQADKLRRPDPIVIRELRDRSKSIAATIAFNRRNPGVSATEQRDTERLLKELRRDYDEVMAQLTTIEAAAATVVTVPKRETVEEMLSENCDLLLQAASSDDETLHRQARHVIDDITGGRIEVFQMGERAKSKGWLQARFHLDVASFAIEELTGFQASNASVGHEVTIDYRKPLLIDEQAETAKRLWDEDMLQVEIAEQMGCLPPYVTKLIRHWFDQRGLPRPNGKKRRKRIETKQRKTPVYKAIANQVIDLMEAGHSNLSIAKQLTTTGATVAKSIAWWHEMRGLPTPSAADRRAQKLARAKSMFDEGILLTDIAEALSYSSRGLTLALKKYFEELGETMPNCQTRRGNASAGEPANGTSATPDVSGPDDAQAA